MCCPQSQSAPRIAVRDVIFIIVNTIIIIIIIISVILKIITIILQIEVGKLLNFLIVVSFFLVFSDRFFRSGFDILLASVV